MPRYRRGLPLGDLPETLGYERRGGQMFDPSAGLKLDWSNRYKTLQFGFQAGPASAAVLQGNFLRTYLMIQNKDAAVDLFVAFGTEASAFNGGLIIPLGNAELIGGEMGGCFCPPETVNVFAASTINSLIIEGSLVPEEVL